MKIISVSSSSKKAGKSLLGAYLVKRLGAGCALKVSTGEPDEHPGPLISDPAVLRRPGTDTGKLAEAGAANVLWVHSRPGELGDHISRALSLFPPDCLLLVEGNSALLHIDPDFSIFLLGVPPERFKPSASAALSRADLVMVETAALSGRPRDAFESELREKAPDALLLFYDARDGLGVPFSRAAEVVEESLAGLERT